MDRWRRTQKQYASPTFKGHYKAWHFMWIICFKSQPTWIVEISFGNNNISRRSKTGSCWQKGTMFSTSCFCSWFCSFSVELWQFIRLLHIIWTRGWGLLKKKNNHLVLNIWTVSPYHTYPEIYLKMLAEWQTVQILINCFFSIYLSHNVCPGMSLNIWHKYSDCNLSQSWRNTKRQNIMSNT